MTRLSRTQWLLFALSKLLIGIGAGLGIATHWYFLQPYWYLAIIGGGALLLALLYTFEQHEERVLEKEQ